MSENITIRDVEEFMAGANDQVLIDRLELVDLRQQLDEARAQAAEWDAMDDVCRTAERWKQAKLRYESGEEVAWEDARQEIQALDRALCRLKEVRA